MDKEDWKVIFYFMIGIFTGLTLGEILKRLVYYVTMDLLGYTEDAAILFTFLAVAFVVFLVWFFNRDEKNGNIR